MKRRRGWPELKGKGAAATARRARPHHACAARRRRPWQPAAPRRRLAGLVPALSSRSPSLSRAHCAPAGSGSREYLLFFFFFLGTRALDGSDSLRVSAPTRAEVYWDRTLRGYFRVCFCCCCFSTSLQGFTMCVASTDWLWVPGAMLPASVCLPRPGTVDATRGGPAWCFHGVTRWRGFLFLSGVRELERHSPDPSPHPQNARDGTRAPTVRANDPDLVTVPGTSPAAVCMRCN